MKLMLYLIPLILTGYTTFSQIITTVEYDCDVFANSGFVKKIHKLKAGDSVKVSSYVHKTKAYFVTKDSVQGFVYIGNVKNNWDLTLMKDDGEKAAIKGRYWVGMSRADAVRALGDYDDTSKIVGSWGFTETLYYKKQKLALVFDNDVLAGYYNY